MFPDGVPEGFEREYGCTEAEWRRWMPEATHPHPLAWDEPCALRVDIHPGFLRISWQILPSRVIALLKLPRLRVVFRFEGVSADERQRFMQRLDLHLRRGGG